MLRRWIPIASLAAALSFGGPALAQNASEQAEARTLFNEGARLLAAGQYPEACAKLEASYHLYAGVGTRGKLAECYEKVGRTASAWAMYEEVVALAGKAGDAAREGFAREHAAALEPKLSHLTIVLPPATDVPGLVIKRGADVVERGALSAAVAVDPGALAFEISAPGRVTKTLDVAIAPGQSVTFDVPALDPVPVAPAPPAGTETPASPAAPEGSATAPTWLRPAGIAVGGVGVAGVVVGTVLALTAKSSYGSAFDSGACQHGTLMCSTDGQHQTDSARSQANVGGVLIGVGAALVVGGGVMIYEGVLAAKRAAAIRVVPDVTQRSASLSVGGSF
jgi:hypothetical protein